MSRKNTLIRIAGVCMVVAGLVLNAKLSHVNVLQQLIPYFVGYLYGWLVLSHK